MNYWSAASVGISPEPFTHDRDMVFAPHLYAGSLTADRALGLDLISIAFGFDEAEREAARYGTTFWSGEWGWFGDPATQADSVRKYAALEDAHLVGGAWWQWKQACGDPHSIGTPGGSGPAESGNLMRVDCPLNVETSLVTEFAQVLARPYPRAAPGRLEWLVSNPDARTLHLVGRTDDAGTLDLWMPGEAEPVVTGEGIIGQPTTASVPGGFRVAVPVSGSYEVCLEPKPLKVCGPLSVDP